MSDFLGLWSDEAGSHYAGEGMLRRVWSCDCDAETWLEAEAACGHCGLRQWICPCGWAPRWLHAEERCAHLWICARRGADVSARSTAPLLDPRRHTMTPEEIAQLATQLEHEVADIYSISTVYNLPSIEPAEELSALLGMARQFRVRLEEAVLAWPPVAP
jgi:hypothetical protein